METHFVFLRNMVEKGGPDPEDYAELDSWIAETSDHIDNSILQGYRPQELILLFGEVFSPETMQGFAFHKPHGYAGDFEIIDRIYTHYISSKPQLTKWDIYWQNHSAATAVRNRADYFSRAIINKLKTSNPIQSNPIQSKY